MPTRNVSLIAKQDAFVERVVKAADGPQSSLTREL